MRKQAEFLKDLEAKIQHILFEYIKTPSFTYSAQEKTAVDFLMNHLSQIPYFKTNPDYFGTYKIPGDSFDRTVCYGMVKGSGGDTVVLIHHFDVVEIEDYRVLKPYAFSPEELAEELLKIKDSLHQEARADLEAGTFLFGRGTADMKGGGSIQLALLEEYSRQTEFKGNVIVLAVPDEENLSAGMRAAVSLLAELKERYGLTYKLMINSEPHQRKVPEKGIFSEGSVGKIMPFVYVRGHLAHIGKVFEGVNPLNLMCEIVRKTELNTDFCDVVGNEMAPPPTWLYLKDSKKQYDVSMPMSASGCFSILTLQRTPGQVMEAVRTICEEAFSKIIEEMNQTFVRYATVKELPGRSLPWQVKVVPFAELFEEAGRNYGQEFKTQYERVMEEISEKLKAGECNIIEANFELVEFVYQYIDDIEPRIVYGLIPPYYPNVSNVYNENVSKEVQGISGVLNSFTQQTFGQTYDKEDFYTGISDLSYTGIGDGEKTLEDLNRYMPLFGDFYSIPFKDIEKIAMPCINIGPWGKDFHKLTERVSKEDLFVRTPAIVHEAVSLVLGHE